MQNTADLSQHIYSVMCCLFNIKKQFKICKNMKSKIGFFTLHRNACFTPKILLFAYGSFRPTIQNSYTFNCEKSLTFFLSFLFIIKPNKLRKWSTVGWTVRTVLSGFVKRSLPITATTTPSVIMFVVMMLMLCMLVINDLNKITRFNHNQFTIIEIY